MPVCSPSRPSFEDVGSKRIKGTLPLASLFGFGKGSRRQPSVDRAITQAKPVGNLLWLPSLLVQLYYLLITRVAARTPRHHQKDAVGKRRPDPVEESAGQIGAAPFARARMHVELEEGIPML